jgi:hypothetical protein
MEEVESMRFRVLICAMALCATAAAVELGEKDADKAVRFTDALEKNPFAEDATDMRRWLIGWLEETPDYLVVVCDVLGPEPANSKYGAELFGQMLFGNVRFQIRNPAQKDETSLQVAGVESVLATYRAMLAKDPAARVEYLDELLALQKQGKLREHLEPTIAEKCSEPDERQQVARNLR